MDQYQQYIHISRYSRWREDLGRRETWPETVQRYVDFFDAKTGGKFTDVLQGKVREAILDMRVMPSMRALMTAGPALEREHLAGFNCSYLAVNSKRSFAEALYILMCGTGVGFSCERQEITKLPPVPEKLSASEHSIVVAQPRGLGQGVPFAADAPVERRHTASGLLQAAPGWRTPDDVRWPQLGA